MLKVGITGGIGSGKSIICKVFKQLGIPVYSADQVAKELLLSDETLRSKVLEYFGSSIYSGLGELNTKHLSKIVFKNIKALEKLNSIVHPAVREHFDKWYNKQLSTGSVSVDNPPYVIKEAAILFESNAHRELDLVISIFTPTDIKIRRVMKRDGMKENEVKQRMKSQMSDEEKIKLSDYVIINDDRSLVIPQILKVHENIIRRTNSQG